MGNAIGWAALANLCTWLTFILAPFVLKESSPCVWFAYGSAYLLLVLLLKVMIARFVLPCIIHICGAASLSIFVPVRIELYAAAMAVCSVISSADIITNTAFVAQFSKQYPCVWIVWLTMLAQPVYVVCMSLPIGNVINFKAACPLCVGTFPWHYITCGYDKQTAVYSTFWEGTQTHQGALIALAHGARVQVVIRHADQYLGEFHKTRLTCTAATKALKQSLIRSIVHTCLESCLFLQIKGMAVRHTCNEGECSTLAVWGCLLGLVTGLHSLYHDGTAMWSIFKDALKGNQRFWSKQG